VAPLLVAVDDHLGVGAGAEGVAERFEARAQLGEVVDLAVEHRDDLAVLARHRLVAAREGDDRKAAGPEGRLAVAVEALRVGAAHRHRGGEGRHFAGLDPAAADVDHAADAAHRSYFPAPIACSRAGAFDSPALYSSRTT